MAQTRLAWPDATRALCVIAVVVYHVLIWNYAWMNSPGAAPGGPWSTVDAILGRTRMPVLFALSGLLASAGILRGFRRGTALRRAASNYYLYVVWLLVYIVFFTLLPSAPFAPGGPASWLGQLLLPTSTLWFIFALAIFPLIIVAARALRIPTAVVFAVALLAWHLSNTTQLWAGSDKLLRNFIFFAIGIYAAPLLRRAATVSWPVAVVFVIVFIVFATAGMTLRLGGLGDAALLMLTNLAALPAAISAIAIACRIPAIARAGGYLGSRTLQVYDLHIPVLAGLTALLSLVANAIYPLVMRYPVIDELYPLVLTAVIVAISLLLGAGITRLTRGRAFALPRRWDAALVARQLRAGGPRPGPRRRKTGPPATPGHVPR